MVDTTGENLGFILSTPRAGSTLLSAILGGHSTIHVPDETWMLLALSSMYHPAWGGSECSNGRYDHPWAVVAMREFLSPDQFTEASRQFAVTAYNSSLQAAGKTVFIDKTPRYFHILPQLENLFPKAKKIWLQRNPLDVAASYYRSWSITPEQLIGCPTIPASFDLTFGLHALARYASSSPNVCEIQYEQLVNNQSGTIEIICQFLGLPHEPGLLDYSRFNSVASLQQHSLGDKKLLDHSRPHLQSVNQWATAFRPDQIQLLIDYLGHEIFERMGYPETISQLNTMGIKFPSKRALEDRLHDLMQKEAFSSLQDELDQARYQVKYYQKSKWVKLGRRFNRLAQSVGLARGQML